MTRLFRFMALAALLSLALAPACGAKAARGKSSGAAASSSGAGASHYTSDTFGGLALRGIGPATTSGRVVDIAVHPTDRATWYVAVACGGVWKTENAGNTWTPVFDKEVSYSIGCVTIDPRQPLTVWVGTGENNSQRSVGYGDGVYRSLDGGRTWQNMGLKASEHIGKILVDPRDSRVVYVAAQGPLWNDGGDRGLYKSTDAGATWKKVLAISDRTGVSDVVFDPRDPDVLYASSYQRRRHVWTLIDGGPESAIYKSTDAGATWRKLTNGLPKEDMGRIGLAVSPADPDVVYALVEAAGEGQGFYRSADAGGSWEKMSGYASTSPQYYQELIPDPKAANRVYSMDTWMMVTEDGGKTFRRVGENSKHVDNHALVIDPADTDHLIAGCDGGMYESWDRGRNWSFFGNLPVAQFYKVALDDAKPFYNVYGGTQDNNTVGGPSRNTSANGIVNADWFVTTGGDGFQSQVDPAEPDIVYSESQHGGLVRYDRKTGETIDIQPQPGPDGAPLRWNWDSPLIISPHLHTRLYFAANRLFRSDDRGDTWTAVSPDLTRQIERNKLPVMGRVWSVDAVSKNASTSFYGNIVSLCESPKQEGLLYVGTDDGLVQVSENGGKTWRRVEKFPGVPDRSYVSRLAASPTDANVVYAAFDNHKMGDFKPYVLRSSDRGKSWTSIAGDLPARGSVYALLEDPGQPGLLFAGTEFGLFFTKDGGRRWVQLKGGLPPIAVKDLAVQPREGDLVVATFGRGFYVLDDLTPLRQVTPGLLEGPAALTPVRTAWAYVPRVPLGTRDKASQGDNYYAAQNPPFGAVFTYYLRDPLETAKKRRLKAESEAEKKGLDTPYPAWDSLRSEAREDDPAIELTVKDAAGNVVRRLTGPVDAGFHRVAWDLRYPPLSPVRLETRRDISPWESPPMGPMVVPGSYTVALSQRAKGRVTPLAGPVTFQVTPLGTPTLPPPDRAEVLAFEQKTGRLQRAVLGAVETAREAQSRLAYLRKAVAETPAADPALDDTARALSLRLKDLQLALSGDALLEHYNEPAPPSIVQRVQGIIDGQWSSTSAPTATQRASYDIAAAQFTDVLGRLRQLVDVDLKALDDKLEAAGAPWTPGRVPTWSKE